MTEIIDTIQTADKEVVTPKMDITLISARPPSLKRSTFTYKVPTQSNSKAEGQTFYDAEYDFVDIGMAEDTDSLVYQANFKKLALAIKAGYTFVSKEQRSLDYIKKRVSELEVAQGQTMWSLITEILSLLIKYHNCFLVKARDRDASSGKVRDINGRKITPIAGYFVASPETMQFRIGKDYNVKQYKHVMPDGRERIFDAEDVVHFHINRKTHHLAGTPAWTPVLDDIRALRRIEENIENLIYQHLYPLYQYKVGTEKAPVERYEDGLTELDIVKSTIQNMPSDGMLVTPERHEIKGLGSESRALRAESYLEYFKKRVIAGSGMSQMDFGESDSANRSTADTLSKLAIDNVKFYQESMLNTFNFEVVRELMLESTLGYDHTNEEKKVELQFNEIDLESQIKMQNHYMLMYQGHAMGEGEMRKSMGRDPIGDDSREDLYLHKVKKQEMEWQMDADVNKAKAVAANKQQPTNQHGKKIGPAKRKSSVSKDSQIQEAYSQLSQDLKRLTNPSPGYVNQLFLGTLSNLKSLYRSTLRESMIRGTKGFTINYQLSRALPILEQSLLTDFDKDLESLFADITKETIHSVVAQELDSLQIDLLEYRMRFIERTLTHKAYVLSKVTSMKANGISKGRIKSDPDGEDFETWDGVVIELNGAEPSMLPPYHVNCSCDIEPEL